MFKHRNLLLFSLVLLLAVLSCQTYGNFLDIVEPILLQQPRMEPPLSEEDQLYIFEELWGIVNEEYLYPDFNGLDWDEVYDVYREKIEAGLTTDKFYLAMDEMLILLGDEHSIFLTPEMVAAEVAEYEGSGEFVGIGVWMEPVYERGRLVILLVFPDSPAEAAGLKAHDSILEVDGQPALNEYGNYTPALDGSAGSDMTLVVQSPGEEPRELVVTRQVVSSSFPVPHQLLHTPDGKRVGYILIPTFSDSSIAEKVEAALETLSEDSPLDGVIIDNRLNIGGFDTVMADTLRLFADGLMGHFVDRHEEEPLEVKAKDINGSTEIPLVVLVGRGTVSFGEVFSGLLRDQGRAYVIGETTYGNVETLWGYDFPDGSRAWIAHSTFRPVNDKDSDWERSGIVPDLEIYSAWDLVTNKTDPVILAALDYFDGED